jgi:uncharacterized protein (TIGR03435 family)
MRIGESRILGADLLPGDPFDVVVRLPESQKERTSKVILDAVESAFGVKIGTQSREVEVLVLRRSGTPGPALKPSAAGGGQSSGGSPGRMEAKGSTLGLLAEFLEFRLKAPVVDETGDASRYDISLSFDKDDPACLIPAVEKQLGMHVARERRTLEFAVVEDTGAGALK